MKRLLRKMGDMREGATLVTVVIATAFMLAIGAIILAATTRYLVSVYMDRNSTENLYDAEGILEEVRCGILEYAGEAGEDAYKDILSNYEMNKGELRTLFGKKYIAGIIDKLKGSAPGTFKIDDSNDPKDPTKGPIEDSLELAKLKSFSKHPEAVKSKYIFYDEFKNTIPTPTPNSDLRYFVDYTSAKGYYLVIKNLVIDYKNEGGYRSSVETDIQINVPDYKFEGSSTLDAAKEFLTVSDGQLILSKTSVDAEDVPLNTVTNKHRLDNTYNYNINMDGNIYAGDIQDTAMNPEYSEHTPSVLVEDKVSAHFNFEKFITRENLVLSRGSKVTLAGPQIDNGGGTPVDTSGGDAYVKNILVVSGGTDTSHPVEAGKGTFLDLNANMYVENDLDIRDTGSTISLGGNYYGYSYNLNNELGTISKADMSSAILINGFNTTIDTIPGLGNVILAGRAFVSRKGTPDQFIGTETTDIMMGESMAVKSNQLAYLVPEKYVKLKHNPLTAVECQDEGLSFTDVNELVDTSVLLSSDIGNYLNKDKPVTGNYGIDSGTYVYLYLNFKDDYNANQYFRHFYLHSDDNDDFDAKTMNERALSYISDRQSGGIRLSPALYYIAGNIVQNYYESTQSQGADRQSDTYYDADGKPAQALLDAGRSYGITYVNMQTTLTGNGSAKNMRLYQNDWNDDGIVDASDVCPKVVDETLINFAGPDTEVIETDDRREPKTNAKCIMKNAGFNVTSALLNGAGQNEDGLPIGLIVSKGDVDIETPCAGVIIAKGNVNFKATSIGKPTFSGLIISDGKITVSSNSKLKSDKLLVDKLISFARSDKDFYKLFYGVDSPVTQNATEMTRCIKYQNWTKNAY